MTARPATQQRNEQILSLIATVDELKRAVIGYNGNVGLVTNVKALVDMMTLINDRGCAYGQMSGIHERQPEPLTTHEDNVTFKWTVDRLVAPVVTGFIVGIIMLIAGFVFVQLQK